MSANQDVILLLEAISKLYKTTVLLQRKMKQFVPEDNYARQISIPTFPGDYKNEAERHVVMSSVNHESENALELMAASHRKHCGPKEPVRPIVGEFKEPTDAHLKGEMDKNNRASKIGLGVAIFFLLGLFSGGGFGAFMTMIIIAAGGVFVFLTYKKKAETAKASLEALRAEALEQFNQEKAEKMAQYAEAVKQYESDCAAYDSVSRDFLQAYSEWRGIYLQHLQEEAAIARQLEADRQAEVERIHREEYTPVVESLNKYNTMVADEHLPVLDNIIGLMKSGRADTFKEAVNLYEDLVYREKQLELERQREENRRQEAAQARADEERRHRDEMRFKEDQERQRRHEAEQQQKMAEQQQKMAEQQHNDMMRAQAEARRQAERDEKRREEQARSEARSQCNHCANYGRCSYRHSRSSGTCAAFTPR